MSVRPKLVFVTGGVVSSLGKGITTASIGLLLKQRGYDVAIQKMDPYLNVDPGTMSPFQHGEVYVTDDGAETDLDLGHYERFAGVTLNKTSNYTTGRIYSEVLTRERRGDYLGKTVQVIPHVTDEIKRAVLSCATKQTDIAIVEVGGTAGDIESLPFLEAMRQLSHERGPGSTVFVHLTLVPYLRTSGELKTKPSQRSTGILRGIGIIPDFLVCRTDRHLEREHFDKLSMFCNVPRNAVIEERDVSESIYEVPVELAKQQLDTLILDKFGLPPNQLDLKDWKDMLQRAVSPSGRTVTIAVVGKYMSLRDAYKSIFEALNHGAVANDVDLDIRAVEAEDLQSGDPERILGGVDGILVPGGFGYRGIEGKVDAVRYARQNRIPFLGICLGLQCAVIETARNVAGLEGADSTEFDQNCSHPVIGLMEEQKSISTKGGTMRLGAYRCVLEEGSLARSVYGRKEISERHRHRYEIDNDYRQTLADAGMSCTGRYPDQDLVEVVERPDHPWFLACQFHPEFKSHPLQPHPLFESFLRHASRSDS
ncbi:CTP synthase [Candidatus Fermentibacteria bacterium]|nr:CTP synthase [Candidatus Fermentibacteria bacterium]